MVRGLLRLLGVVNLCLACELGNDAVIFYEFVARVPLSAPAGTIARLRIGIWWDHLVAERIGTGTGFFIFWERVWYHTYSHDDVGGYPHPGPPARYVPHIRHSNDCASDAVWFMLLRERVGPTGMTWHQR
jgi:hypothetical protein